ncbi:protein aardvark [Anaeramoeba ignava]|uniref:Protein aardvark n=1 Tax=Anaeramoeba ignava TaxID=1746090 RepID=A0A9Q0LGF2_ANAIG|nr:protein aardvark [Anaeramoeba ignava]
MEEPEICPICFQNYSQERKPMIICQDGHSICELCLKTVDGCPFCRTSFDDFKPILNRILLQLIQTIQKKPEEQIIPFIPLSELEVEPKPFAIGGTAQIFKAKWKGKDVVIKRINVVTDEKANEQFENELKLAMKLEHPSIIKMYGKTEMDNLIGLVVEFANQGDLSNKISSLTFEEQVDYSLQIIQGIKLLHSHSVIHRDLKPENILVCDNRPKITDFGISKVREHTLKVTSATVSFGFSAPELFRKENAYDTSCDIFSLSMILYEIFSKKKPFGSENPMMITVKVIQGQRPEFPQDFPKELSELIKKGWSSNPKERCTLNEFTECLDRIKAEILNQAKKSQDLLQEIELKRKVQHLEQEQEPKKLIQEKEEILKLLKPYFAKFKLSIQEHEKDQTKEMNEIDINFIFQCMKNFSANQFIQETCCFILRKFTETETKMNEINISLIFESMKNFSTNQFIQETCCFILRKFTEIETKMNEINISLIFESMKNFSTNQIIQETCCFILRKFTETGKKMNEINISLIFESMKNFSTNQFIQETCCFILRKFTETETKMNEINISLIFESMKNFSTNQIIQETCCFILRKFTETETKMNEINISLIFESMKNFSTNQIIQETCCFILRKFTETETKMNEINISLIFESMKNFSTNQIIQETCCFILRKFTETETKMNEININLIFESMKNFSTNQFIQETCCFILRKFTETETKMNEININLIFESMKNFSTNQIIQETCCFILRKFTETETKTCCFILRKFTETETKMNEINISLIFESMKNFSTNQIIQETCCFILRKFTETETKMNEINISLIFESMKNFSTNQFIQENCCFILRKFTETETKMNEINISLIFESMKNFSTNQFIQETCYFILRKFIETETKMNEINISLIFESMKNFPINQIIQETCCFILRKFIETGKRISFNLPNLNGFNLIIKAMNNFPFNRFLQLQSILIIINIGKENENKTQIETNSGIDTIISTMVNFTDKDKEIYNKGIEALGVLVLNKKEIQKLLKEKKKIIEKRDEIKLKQLKEEYRKSKPGRKVRFFINSFQNIKI